MWIPKNDKSKDLYESEDLWLFFDGLSGQVIGTAFVDRPQGQTTDIQGVLTSHAPYEGRNHHDNDPHHRGRDQERPARTHGNRDQVLQAVTHHSEMSEREKSCSPQKPLHVSTRNHSGHVGLAWPKGRDRAVRTSSLCWRTDEYLAARCYVMWPS
ncbi:hypothetical protein NDU88_004225 [Pleurodeles waltl]|uniref:Uncharacterized protein n=1 Tax=Pleurodeles waltl TaxID=8319 RepID=A0AAV7VI44_PLEWA|nr:hypothetical protein NDU88_004225 [Pleurodeles waltl]